LLLYLTTYIDLNSVLSDLYSDPNYRLPPEFTSTLHPRRSHMNRRMPVSLGPGYCH